MAKKKVSTKAKAKEVEVEVKASESKVDTVEDKAPVGTVDESYNQEVAQKPKEEKKSNSVLKALEAVKSDLEKLISKDHNLRDKQALSHVLKAIKVQNKKK